MGTRREVKTHWFISDNIGTRQGHPSCGVECWISAQSEYEADTAPGNRIDVTRMFPFEVTCEKCIKAGMPTKVTKTTTFKTAKKHRVYWQTRRNYYMEQARCARTPYGRSRLVAQARECNMCLLTDAPPIPVL